MEKIECGMYVRTKWGIAKYMHNLVTKTTIYRVVDRKIVYDNVEDWEDCLLDNEIIKASYNIIDLIEVGDYVNGYKIYSGGKKHFDYILTWDDVENYYMKIPLLSVDIKSIVTKEQFESMQYRLGD